MAESHLWSVVYPLVEVLHPNASQTQKQTALETLERILGNVVSLISQVCAQEQVSPPRPTQCTCEEARVQVVLENISRAQHARVNVNSQAWQSKVAPAVYGLRLEEWLLNYVGFVRESDSGEGEQGVKLDADKCAATSASYLQGTRFTFMPSSRVVPRFQSPHLVWNPSKAYGHNRSPEGGNDPHCACAKLFVYVSALKAAFQEVELLVDAYGSATNSRSVCRIMRTPIAQGCCDVAREVETISIRAALQQTLTQLQARSPSAQRKAGSGPLDLQKNASATWDILQTSAKQLFLLVLYGSASSVPFVEYERRENEMHRNAFDEFRMATLRHIDTGMPIINVPTEPLVRCMAERAALRVLAGCSTMKDADDACWNEETQAWITALEHLAQLYQTSSAATGKNGQSLVSLDEDCSAIHSQLSSIILSTVVSERSQQQQSTSGAPGKETRQRIAARMKRQAEQEHRKEWEQTHPSLASFGIQQREAANNHREQLLVASHLIADIASCMHQVSALEGTQGIKRTDRIEAKKLHEKYNRDLDIHFLHELKDVWLSRVEAAKVAAGRATVYLDVDESNSDSPESA